MPPWVEISTTNARHRAVLSKFARRVDDDVLFEVEALGEPSRRPRTFEHADDLRGERCVRVCWIRQTVPARSLRRPLDDCEKRCPKVGDRGGPRVEYWRQLQLLLFLHPGFVSASAHRPDLPGSPSPMFSPSRCLSAER